MSFSSDLKQAVRDELLDWADRVEGRDAADCISNAERNMGRDALEKAVEPAIGLYGDDADRLSEDKYDKLIDRLAGTIAGAIAHDNLKAKRLIRDVSREDEDDLIGCYNDFIDMCEDFVQASRGRRSNRDDRDRDRNDRNRNRERSSRRNERSRNSRPKTDRHSNRYERDAVVRDEEDEPKSNTRETVVKPAYLDDQEIVTAGNFKLLPPACKDVPLYFAGLEQLVYSADKPQVDVKVLEVGEFDVNYELHRTDIYLTTNRGPINPGHQIDKLEKELKKAAIEKVEAYVLKQKSAAGADDDVEDFIINKLETSKSCVVSGVYPLEVPALGSEAQVRAMLKEHLGKKFDDHVIGASVSHPIFAADEVIAKTKEWTDFQNHISLNILSTSLGDARQMVNSAQKLFDPASYAVFHDIINEGVCNAISSTMKLGVKTSSFIVDWDGLEKLIDGQKDSNPQLLSSINFCLTNFLPTLLVENDEIRIVRDYVFLPISSNELSIASPIRYATIDPSVRPDLCAVLRKLNTTNAQSLNARSIMTLVTLENNSLVTVANRNNINANGYYVFKPIK